MIVGFSDEITTTCAHEPGHLVHAHEGDGPSTPCHHDCQCDVDEGLWIAPGERSEPSPTLRHVADGLVVDDAFYGIDDHDVTDNNGVCGCGWAVEWFNE